MNDIPDDSAQSTPFMSLMRFYQAEARDSATGDTEDRSALLATLHPDIVLYQPESLPYGGEWRGREAFGQWLDAFVQTIPAGMTRWSQPSRCAHQPAQREEKSSCQCVK